MFERLAPEHHDTLDGIPDPAENPHLHGHREVSGMLAAAYRTGKMPHAILLSGPLGIGKATLAFHLAHHLLKYPDYAKAPPSFGPPDGVAPLAYRRTYRGAVEGTIDAHGTRASA